MCKVMFPRKSIKFTYETGVNVVNEHNLILLRMIRREMLK